MSLIVPHRIPLLTSGSSKSVLSGFAAGFTSSLNQFLEIANNTTLTVPTNTGFSICGWFFPTIAGAYKGMAGRASVGTAGGDSYGLQIAHPATTDIWEFFLVNSGAYHATDGDGTAPVTLNAWTFVSGTYNRNSGTGTLTVNTTVFSANLNAADVNTGTAAFDIGGRGAAGVQFDGRIDAVGFWLRTLSQSEVTTLYNNGNGLRFSTLPSSLMTNLSAWWDLDEPTGTMRFDATSNGNNLTDHNNVAQVTGKT